ncbi:MAG: hypothetical protein HUK19_09300 [Fibrobacter sp.]|nr:hypothetical protein [Fibrobacter sp.]
MKRIWLVPLASFLAFAACSESSSSGDDFGGTGDIQGFIPSEINAYTMDNDMNIITLVEPVCEEQKRELVWSRNGGETIEYSYKYDSGKGLVYLGEGTETVQFDYLGSSFPKGAWRMSDANNEDGEFITAGMIFESDKVETGIAYSGKCFLKDIYSGQMMGDMGDEEDIESAMESALFKDLVIDCNKMSLGDSLAVNINNWSRKGIEIKYTYGKKSCTNTATTRFAYNESDCKAAYNEFKATAKDGDVFEFDEFQSANSNQQCYDEFSAYLSEYIMKNLLQDLLGGLGGDEDVDLGGLFGRAVAKKVAKKMATVKF